MSPVTFAGMQQSFEEVLARTKQNRIEFLQNDLELCLTFIDVAHTELQSMKDREAATRIIGKAEEGYATISSFLPKVDDGPEKNAIQNGLTELRRQIDSFQQELSLSASA